MNIEEFKARVNAYYRWKGDIKERQDTLDKEKKLLDDEKNSISRAMEALEIDRFDTEECSVHLTEDVGVSISGERREEFFDYLRERGIFEDMITVNANTLRAWYKREGVECVPGLNVSPFYKLTTRTKK